MGNSTTIKISNEVRDKLTDLKIDNEGYSVIIANLLKENEMLKNEVAYLKEDKSRIYQLSLNPSDSKTIADNIYKIMYFITLVLAEKKTTDEEKVNSLKEHLNGMLENNPSEVKETISIFKTMLQLEEKTVPVPLMDFEKYVLENY